jgi:hypothetical protein
MSDTMPYGERELRLLRYGPLVLVSLDALELGDLERLPAGDARWNRLGLLLDPQRDCGNDYATVWRTLRVFWAFLSGHAGSGWTLEIDAIASRIFLHEGPVVIGMWEQAPHSSAIPGEEDPDAGGWQDEEEDDGH